MEMIEQIIMVMISMLVGQEGVNLLFFIRGYSDSLFILWSMLDACGGNDEEYRGAGAVLSAVVLLTINRLSFTITEKAPTRAFSWLKSGYYRFHI